MVTFQLQSIKRNKYKICIGLVVVGAASFTIWYILNKSKSDNDKKDDSNYEYSESIVMDECDPPLPSQPNFEISAAQTAEMEEFMHTSDKTITEKRNQHLQQNVDMNEWQTIEENNGM